MAHKPLANTYERATAGLIDYAIFMIVLFIYLLNFGESTGDGHEVTGVKVLPILIFWFCYFIIIEGIWSATLGYQLM